MNIFGIITILIALTSFSVIGIGVYRYLRYGSSCIFTFSIGLILVAAEYIAYILYLIFQTTGGNVPCLI